MTFAALLIELRLAQGLSQEALAAQAAVSVRAISDLERGTTRRPHRDTLHALAGALALAPAERERFERAARRAPPSAGGRRAARPPALPAPVSSIIGRDADLAAVLRLVRGPAVRLVTVCGPGGVGKSRLAVEVGWRVGTTFERVDAVDLSPLRRADDVPAAIATVLGCRTVGVPPAEAVATRIGDIRWLLVLDSVEQVPEAAAELSALLARCPRLTLLATGRAALRLRGEHLWPLEPLPLPADDEPDPGTNPSVALLVERTRAVRPGFALGPANTAAVLRLCRRLDGLPLAIELAAAHLRTQEPADLVAQWDSRFTGPDLDRPDRHRSLRQAVEWSTERLAAPDRLLLGLLSTFPGGAAPALARAVLSGAGLDAATLDPSVTLLAANSLVRLVDQAGTARITMLDTIREVAVDLLVRSGVEDTVRAAQASAFFDLVRAGPPDAVDVELDNVRAALAWSAGQRPALFDVALVRALTGYFAGRSQFAEAGRTLAMVARAPVDEATRAWALHGAGLAANEAGDHLGAVELAERSAAGFDGLADPVGRGTALTVAGNAYKALGRYEQAQRVHRTALDLARTAGDPRRVTIALNNLGTLAHDRGDHASAREHYGESLRIKRELGDGPGTAIGLMNLGALDNDLGRYADARARLGQAVELFRGGGAPHWLAFALALLAEAETGLGADEAATAAATEALELARPVGYGPAIGLALSRLGDLALGRDDLTGAERLYQEALDHVTGAPEVARVLERLAAAKVDAAPDEARRLLDRAGEIRRTHHTPAPPADRPLIEATDARTR